MRITLNINRGSSYNKIIDYLHGQNKFALSADLNCKQDQNDKPVESVEPAPDELQVAVSSEEPELTVIQEEQKDDFTREVAVGAGESLVTVTKELKPDMEPQESHSDGTPEEPQAVSLKEPQPNIEPQESHPHIILEEPQADIEHKEPQSEKPQAAVAPEIPEHAMASEIADRD